MRRSFQDLSKSAFTPLYRALVRQHPEYGMPACSPSLVADINRLGCNWHSSPALRKETTVLGPPFLAVVTWLPHSRYSRVSWMLIRTCFFSLPLVVAIKGTPKRYSKVRATAGEEGQLFRWGLWNIGISYRLPSLQLLLSAFSRRGWRKCGHLPRLINPIFWFRKSIYVVS